MARTLVTARDMYQHSDEFKRDSANALKGHVIKSFEDGHEFGSKEVLPDFVVIDTPGVALSAVENYERPLRRLIDYATVANDMAVDGFRVDVFTTNKTVSGKGKITRAQVENFLGQWGVVVVNANETRVRFDFTVYNLIVSMLGGFPVIFVEDSYNVPTGQHTITATYNNAPVSQKVISHAEEILTNTGAVILDSNPGSIQFTLTRDVVIPLFKTSIKDKIEEKFLFRQFYFDSIFVDQVISNGGILSTTGQDAIAHIVDRATE